MKIKNDGKKVKYLGSLIECLLNWHFHANELSIKLSIATEIRHYVKFEILCMIHHGIISPILHHGSQIWGQINNHSINKALRVINFKSAQTSLGPLHKECKILKLNDNVKLQNFLFAYGNLKK